MGGGDYVILHHANWFIVETIFYDITMVLLTTLAAMRIGIRPRTTFVVVVETMHFFLNVVGK